MKILDSKCRKFTTSQKGGALITVLFLVAVLSILILTYSNTVSVASQRAFFAKTQNEVYWNVVGIEYLAVAAIERALEASPEILNASSPLIAQNFSLPTENGLISLMFVDQTRCLNLNGIVDSKGEILEKSKNESVQLEFERYLSTIGVGQGEAITVYESMLDWIDTNSDREVNGAETSHYSALSIPYQTGSANFADISEIRAVAGVTQEMYRQIAPGLCALPTNDSVTTNVNLLEQEDAQLLAAILDVTITQAQSIISARPPGGYQAVSDFENSLNSVIISEGSGRFGINSEYLIAAGSVDRGDVEMKFNILFKVDGSEISVVSRQLRTSK